MSWTLCILKNCTILKSKGFSKRNGYMKNKQKINNTVPIRQKHKETVLVEGRGRKRRDRMPT